MPAGIKYVIHVCQQTIARNRKNGSNEPPIIIRNYRGSIRCQEVEIDGVVSVRHSPHKPLKCGARVWIETRGKVRPVPWEPLP